MVSVEIGRLGAALPSSGALGCASFSLDTLRNFPGIAFLVERGGTVFRLASGRAELIPGPRADGYATEVAARAAKAIARGVVSVEILGQAIDPPIEATILPLDGEERALVLLRPLEFATAFHRQLIESRQRYKDFVETVSDFCWETDCDGRFTFVSPSGAADWSPDEMVGRSVGEFLAGDDHDGPVPEVFRTDRFAQNDDIWFRSADGAMECLSVVASPRFDDEGTWYGSSGLCRKITGQRRDDGETAQIRMKTHLASHLAHTVQDETDPKTALAHAVSAIGLAICATGGVVLRGEGPGAMAETARWGNGFNDELVARAMALHDTGAAIDDVHGDLHFVGVSIGFQGASKGMAVFWREIERGLFAEDDRGVLEVVERPVGAAIARLISFETALSRSRTDALTGILNRAGFKEEASRRLMRLKGTSEPGCLFFIDLNNFKLVNDLQGHHEGDAVLIDVARILRESTRASDLVGRLGGDEFVLWIDGADADAAGARADAIIAKCRTLADRSCDPARPFGASIGLALCDPAQPETIDQMLMRADIAMYRAKRRKSGYAIADAGEAGR